MRAQTGGARPLIRRITCVVAISLLLAAPASANADSGQAATQVSTDAEASTKPELVIGHVSATASLDFSLNSGQWAELIPLMYASLVYAAHDGTLQPWLAESWQYVGDDFRTFEITLRQDAAFSDGTPVNADAVKKYIEYHASGPEGPTWGGDGLESVEAVDEWTVRMQLQNPNPDLPLYFSQRDSTLGAVAAPAAVDNPESLQTMTAGAGPYVLDPENTVTEEVYTLVPNEHYYDQEAVHWSKVTIRIITEPNSMLQALRTGEVDVARGDLSTVEGAESAGLNVTSATVAATGLMLEWRTGDYPLADVRVRQALNYALDREAIAEAIVGEYGGPTSQILTLGRDPAFDDYYEYDPERALELLAEAGYPNGEGLPAIGMNVPEVGRTEVPLIQTIAQYWSEIGVEGEVVNQAVPAWSASRAANEFPTNFMTICICPFQLTYGESLAPGGALNPNDNVDPTLDQLYEDALASDNPGEVWQQMSAYTVEQALFLPVVTYQRAMFHTDNVGCVEATEEQPFAHAHEWCPPS
jgi:peptide/nickel transport system substrate-binding protein